MLLIRHEVATDREAVAEVNRSAFGRDAEARLVEAVRGLGTDVLSLVACEGKRVVGHILFSEVTIHQADDRWTAIGLGPMAVAPECQRRGIGAALIAGGLEECRRIDRTVVFVLGHPDYYPRFGFVPASEAGLYYRDESFAPAFFVIELEAGALRGRAGRVVYSAPFEDV